MTEKNDNNEKSNITFRQALKEYEGGLNHFEPAKRQLSSNGKLKIEGKKFQEKRHLMSGGKNLYHVEGLQKSILKKLKRGNISIFAECDLHGYKYTEALEELENFFKGIKNERMVAILLIHGKGLSSIGAKPILKPLVKEFLLQEPGILAFLPAPRNLGGEGATLALLSRKFSKEDS